MIIKITVAQVKRTFTLEKIRFVFLDNHLNSCNFIHVPIHQVTGMLRSTPWLHISFFPALMASTLRVCTQKGKTVCCAVNVPLPLTDTVQLPVNGPCKSRYLAINVNCTTVLSLNIQLYNCIAVFPRLHPNTTYMPNTDDTDYTDNRVVFIIWTDNVNAICTTTISSDIQLWYCIAVFPRLYPSNTYLPNTDYTDYTDNRVVFIIWTDNVNAPLTYHCR